LLADAVGLAVLSIRPRRSLEAENLVLRRQLALFKERGVKPRRIDAATRASLALLSRWCDWRSCLIVVRPETVSPLAPRRMAPAVALPVQVGASAHPNPDIDWRRARSYSRNRFWAGCRTGALRISACPVR
jgi:hypothetical protein